MADLTTEKRIAVIREAIKVTGERSDLAKLAVFVSTADITWLLDELEKAHAFDQAWFADDPEQYIENPDDAGEFCDLIELNTPTRMLTGKRLRDRWAVVFADEDDCPEVKWFDTEVEAKAFVSPRERVEVPE